MPTAMKAKVEAGLPEPEPVTPFSVIRDASCHGVTGKIGATAASQAIVDLAAAGFVIVRQDSEVRLPSK